MKEIKYGLKILNNKPLTLEVGNNGKVNLFSVGLVITAFIWTMILVPLEFKILILLVCILFI